MPPLDTMKTVVFGVRSPLVVTFVTLNIGEKNLICNSNLWQQAKLENHWYQSQD